MGTREVTQAQYAEVMGDIPPSSKKGTDPISGITWQNATEFCRRLSKKEGQLYRLPTEAEWEYACRAGTSTDFWWGDDPNDNPNKSNPFGLYDMHGSLGEWCSDWYGYGYYYLSPTFNPQGPVEKSENMNSGKVIRGDPKSRNPKIIRDLNLCSSYARESEDNLMFGRNTFNNIGFRIVLEPDWINEE